MSDHSGSVRAIVFALLANLGIAITKTVAAVITASGSLLAESVHSYADCANQLLLMLGLRRGARGPDAEHPLGHGKAVFFWSFIVALMLFSMGGLFSVYEGVHKLSAPEPVKDAWIGLAVLGVAMVLEGLSLAGALREVRKLRGDTPFFAWFKRTRKAELVVVLGEDSAALAGLAAAFGFLLAAWLTGNPAFDAAGSIAVGIVLIGVAVFVAVRIHSFLIGTRADDDLEEAIRARAFASPGIVAVHELVTLQLGGQVMLSIKVGMEPGLDIGTAVERINAFERAVKEEFPEVRFTYVEPDSAPGGD